MLLSGEITRLLLVISPDRTSLTWRSFAMAVTKLSIGRQLADEKKKKKKKVPVPAPHIN